MLHLFVCPIRQMIPIRSNSQLNYVYDELICHPKNRNKNLDFIEKKNKMVVSHVKYELTMHSNKCVGMVTMHTDNEFRTSALSAIKNKHKSLQ